MVERELDLPVEDVGDGEQGGGRRVGAFDDRPDVAQHGEVRDGHDVHARVAAGIAVCAELRQQACAGDAGLLGELALRRLLERLVRALEAARDRPHPLERRLAAADQEDVEQAFGHGQDHDAQPARHPSAGPP